MSAPEYQTPPSSSGGGSSWLVILLVVLGLIVVVCGGICGGCIYMGRQAVNQAGKAMGEFAEGLQLMPAMVAAQQAVVSDQQVIDRLGEPVQLVSMGARQGKGKLQPAGETFQFDVSGPKGKAIASCVATNTDGTQFRAVKITVTFTDGSVVEVTPPEDQTFDPANMPPVPETPADGSYPNDPAVPSEPDSGEIKLDPELNSPIEAK